jgi:protein involved in polysaccharide export with SLBB domain
MRLLHEAKIGNRFMTLIGVFGIAITIGCQGTVPFMKPTETQPGRQPKFTLGAGDVLDFKFFYNPELNDTQTVRPDGKIMLQLIGEVSAHGKTPSELQEELVKLYTPELKRPMVAVIVRSLYERRVYVGGEVKTPGLIPIPGSLTAFEAIMQAGGFNPATANLSSVIIIRHKDGKRYGGKLDFTEVLKGKEGPSFFLEPRDIVYVPRTAIVEVNQWVDQYINKMIPRTGFAASYPMGAGTILLDTSTALGFP